MICLVWFWYSILKTFPQDDLWCNRSSKFLIFYEGKRLNWGFYHLCNFFMKPYHFLHFHIMIQLIIFHLWHKNRFSFQQDKITYDIVNEVDEKALSSGQSENFYIDTDTGVIYLKKNLMNTPFTKFIVSISAMYVKSFKYLSYIYICLRFSIEFFDIWK